MNRMQEEKDSKFNSLEEWKEKDEFFIGEKNKIGYSHLTKEEFLNLEPPIEVDYVKASEVIQLQEYFREHKKKKKLWRYKMSNLSI